MPDHPLVPMPLVRGARGAVVAPHHLATAAGLSILRAGGHAVDAAIATNAVLAVVLPSGCGIGGDAFWLIWDEMAGRQTALNGSGRAPAAADPVALRAGGMATLPHRGPHTITVPGAVRSWSDAHGRHGRLPVAELLAPAIELAAGGFPAWPGFIGAVEATLPRVVEAIGTGSGFEQVYRPHGRPWRPGERVRLPALAAGVPAPHQRFSPAVGLYWALAPAFQQQGYATEAARALVDYAFGHLNLRRLIATTAHDNLASQGVMRRLGMRLERNPFPDPPWFQVVGVLDYDDYAPSRP